MSSIHVERFSGSAGDFHSKDVPAHESGRVEAHVWWFEPTREAVVLGSTQDSQLLDVDRCARLGVDVVRRRSGGGLVLLSSEGTMWLDVVLPAEHPLWVDDVTASSLWLGEIWMSALEAAGVGPLEQHRNGLVRTDLGDLICFAGRGPGEVFIGSPTIPGSHVSGSKVVGISQRRTRAFARFQCAVSIRWDPERLVALLRDPSIEVSRLLDAGSTIQIDRDFLRDTMSSLLTERLQS